MISKLIKKFIAVLLAFSMVFCAAGPCFAGFFQNTVFEPKVYHMVSMGDSMTNGYRLPDFGNSQNGYQSYSPHSYPKLLENWLSERLKCIYDTVKHSELAVTGLRTADIDFLLSLDLKKNELYGSAKDIVLPENLNNLTSRDYSSEDMHNWWIEAALPAELSAKDIWYGSSEQSGFDRGDFFTLEHHLRGTLSVNNQDLCSVIQDYQRSVADADLLVYGGGGGDLLFSFVCMLQSINDDINNNLYDPSLYHVQDLIEHMVKNKKGEDNIRLQRLLTCCVNDLDSAIRKYAGDSAAVVDRIVGMLEYEALSFIGSYIDMIRQIERIRSVAGNTEQMDFIYLGLINPLYDVRLQLTEKFSLPVGKMLSLCADIISGCIKNIPKLMQLGGEAKRINFVYVKAPSVDRFSSSFMTMDETEDTKLFDQIKKDFDINLSSKDDVRFIGLKKAMTDSLSAPVAIENIKYAVSGIRIDDKLRNIINNYQGSSSDEFASLLLADKEVAAYLIYFSVFGFDTGVGVHPSIQGHLKIFNSIKQKYNSKIYSKLLVRQILE